MFEKQINKMDLFDTEPIVPIKMSPQDFFDKAQRLLTNIANSYSQAWQNKVLSENEYPDDGICEKCTGCGLFKNSEGNGQECFQDRINGECYYRFCNYAMLGEELETSHLEEVFNLILVDELDIPTL